MLLDILLPPFCLGCKREGVYLCKQCRNGIDEFRYFLCPVCKRRSIDGRLDDSCRKVCGLTRFFGSPLPYADKTVRLLIHAFKYQRVKNLATPLSRILIEFLERNQFTGVLERYGKNLALVPVPLYDFRARDRGFNQAAEIAREIGAHYDIKILEKNLIKKKNTPPQAEVKGEEARMKNIENAFATKNPLFFQGKIVLLVDDVYTSGATMRECARVLKTSGAAQVWGITVARS
jgi:ComF family protein